MGKSVIDLQKVAKSYGPKQVLKGVSFQVQEGSVYGLLGRNGAGKTTLIKTILGLIKPDSGDVQTLNEVPWTLSESAKAKLGYVPQLDRMYPWLRVKEMIAYVASFYEHWNHSLVEQLLKQWGLKDDEIIGTLSEGQAQILSIVLALGHEPQLLIFDEPVASLDPAARRQFLKTILNLVSERSCTIFFSTHITSDLERVADHVAIIDKGQSVFNGMLDELKDSVKKLRINTPNCTRADLVIPGVMSMETTEDCTIVCVKEFSYQQQQELQRKLSASVEVYDLNLEDIFLEITR